MADAMQSALSPQKALALTLALRISSSLATSRLPTWTAAWSGLESVFVYRLGSAR